MRVLIVEDDPRLAALLDSALSEAGYTVETVADGRVAYDWLLLDESFDVVVLDWMLPTMDGATLVSRVRALGLGIPILMLTARNEVQDRIHGLNVGADDYLAKPFDIDELLARIQALHRRSQPASFGRLEVGALIIDAGARRVFRGDVEIALSAREFDILHLLAEQAGRIVTRQDILDEVWDGETDVRSNVIDVHLARIREKIDKAFGTETITTLRGVGYRLETSATDVR